MLYGDPGKVDKDEKNQPKDMEMGTHVVSSCARWVGRAHGQGTRAQIKWFARGIGNGENAAEGSSIIVIRDRERSSGWSGRDGTGQDTGRDTDVDDVVEDDARRRGHIRLWVIEIDGRRVGGRGLFQVRDYSGRNV